MSVNDRQSCFSVGITGNCGATCPVFLDGQCEEPQDILPDDQLQAMGYEVQEDQKSIVKPRPKISARLAFGVYKLAERHCEYAKRHRGDIFGILTMDDPLALEYQASDEMRDSAERVLNRRLAEL